MKLLDEIVFECMRNGAYLLPLRCRYNEPVNYDVSDKF